jgi:hypothetical protein
MRAPLAGSFRPSLAGLISTHDTLGAERELEVVLAQYASTAHKIASFQALVDAGTFSAALFTQLDLENARRDELGERKAALESKVETARAKNASLHNVAVIHLYWRYLATWFGWLVAATSASDGRPACTVCGSTETGTRKVVKKKLSRWVFNDDLASSQPQHQEVVART